MTMIPYHHLSSMSIHHYTKYLLPFLTLTSIFIPLSSSFKTLTTLSQGTSLSSPGDVLVSSPTRIFTASFHAVGDNAYCFAIWYTHAPPHDGNNSTVVWMANRDQPVNGRNTKLSLLHSGNLVLEDAGLLLVWSTGTKSSSGVALQLHDDGDLVLYEEANATTIWRSFESPTDTLLPQQPLTRKTRLISSRSPTNQSSGFYEFYFDNDNVLRLLYSGVEVTSVFWPPAWLISWEAGRSTYNTTKIAMLDPYGRFSSSDNFTFQTSDAGIVRHRRMTLDSDGLIRIYSLNKDKNIWEVSWQLPMPPCNIHGICGANSLCRYTQDAGRRCSCVPGYKIKDDRDWSEGCVPDFDLIPCQPNGTANGKLVTFHRIIHAEFYGNDFGFYKNTTLEACERLCLSYCDCRAYQFTFDNDTKLPTCYPKFLLFNGYQSPEFDYSTYLRLPNHMLSALNKIEPAQSRGLHCTDTVVEMERSYVKVHKYEWLRFLIWSVSVLGAVELICVLLFVYKTRVNSSNKLREQGFLQAATGFRRFSYAEMKKATRNFSEEIGRGGSGVVYKGVLPDNRVAAIKCLSFASSQGELAEFLAEINLIGRLNHANLVETWGYCAEAKHRVLVYEYMENGSLADNLDSDKLDRRKRFEIALGTAKGLAYLHDECLEWVLHCDVKPQNILLDRNYEAKVADFGLSKQVERSGVERLNVSAIRGTRGYMAPEWVYNLPITAKVDVYSYGIVVLEMLIVKEMINVDSNNGEILEECDDHDKNVENLERVGLQCAQENRDARPTMKQVVNMLLGH